MATVTIRPNSDNSVIALQFIDGGSPSFAQWAGSNGATKNSNGVANGTPFFPNVNDASDATLATYGIFWSSGSGNSADSGTFQMDFASFSFPAFTIINSVQGFIRHREVAAGGSFGATTATVFAPTGNFGAETIGTNSSLTTDTLASRTTRPGGGAWTQADIDGLVMGYHASVTSAPSTSGAFTVADMWFVVDYTVHTAPTATVTAPTGTVLPPQPTVTWTYSDAEGDPQNAYQVRIFSAAQYGIGGFDPQTSPNTWDSGVVGGAGTSQVIGTPLVQGTYRAYVKVSDAINGFGVWSFSQFDEVFNGTVIMPGTGDLSASGVTTTVASALLDGFGGLIAQPTVFSVAGARSTIGSKSPILDDSTGRLGCGTAGAFITGKCGFPTVCSLENITDVEWDRRLDAVSEATVKIGLSGGLDGACCECLNELEPWCHELHITRNGVEQWCGPITKVVYTYNEVIISAVDMIGWLGVKIPAADSTFAVATNLTDIAYGTANSIFNVAMIEEDPCYLLPAYFSAFANAITGLRTYKAFGATSLDYLNDLAHSGLNYTTLGRRVVLSGEITQLTPLIILRDEHILGEVEIVKDGTLAGNRYYVHYKNDLGIPSVYTHPTSYCYGKIEKMLTNDTITTGANATTMAQAYANATFVAPRTLEIPAGSKLNPDTPWTIQDMVCGARVDVQISGLCFKIQQSFTLSAMKLVETASEGEQILITLVPINSVGIS